MKVIFRVLVILVVATLIGGAIFAAVSAGGSSGNTQRGFEGGDRPALPNGEAPGNFRPDGDGGRSEGGSGLPFGMVKGLVIITIIAAIYFNINKFFGKKKSIPAKAS
jgi:hypothetical protein